MKNEARLFDYPPARRRAVVETLRGALEDQPDVVFAYVPGSFVSDRPFRDVDGAVLLDIAEPPDEPHEHHPDLRALELSEEIERALSRAMESAPPPIHVRALNDAPLGFRYQVLRGGRLVVSRDESMRVPWEARTLSRYPDLKPLRDQALKEAMMACRLTTT